MSRRSRLLFCVLLVSFRRSIAAFGVFAPVAARSRSISTERHCRRHYQRQTHDGRHHHDMILCMGKGLNRAQNKQADLARKLELAKKQNQNKPPDEHQPQTSSEASNSLASLSDAEIKKRNDRLRFEEMLKRESANVLNAYSNDGYLSKEQEEEEINAASKC